MSINYKYLTISIILATTIALFLYIFFPYITGQNSYITVNDKKISFDEFNDIYQKQTGNTNRDEIINSVVTRELLIQEALKEEVDRQEPFLKSVRKFYEDSLIRGLIDKKKKNMNNEVDAFRVANYSSLLQKKIHISRITGKKETKIIIPFNKLSPTIQYIISGLKEGETSEAHYEYNDSGEDVSTEYRLDKVENSERTLTNNRIHTDKILNILKKQKNEFELTNWLRELKDKASIQIKKEN